MEIRYCILLLLNMWTILYGVKQKGFETDWVLVNGPLVDPE